MLIASASVEAVEGRSSRLLGDSDLECVRVVYMLVLTKLWLAIAIGRPIIALNLKKKI